MRLVFLITLRVVVQNVILALDDVFDEGQECNNLNFFYFVYHLSTLFLFFNVFSPFCQIKQCFSKDFWDLRIVTGM